MGILSWWKNRLKRKVKKYSAKIYHINTTHDKRALIIDELLNIPGEDSTRALLNRFKLTLHEKPIMDESEKEKISKELISRGYVEPVKEFIENEQNVSRPFDILRAIVSQDEFIKFALDVLTTEEVLFDERVIEKRLLTLEVIADLKSPEIYKKIKILINDADDRVKIAALNILSNQDEIDEVRENLLNIMVDSETSPRIVNVLIDIFARKEWKLTGFKNKVEDIIPRDDYFINKSGIIRKR